jgi:hypothetical protein
MKFRKWILYTVCIGAVPFLARLLIFFIHNKAYNEKGYLINEMDMIYFALALNLSNINELDSLEEKNVSAEWKSTMIGISILQLVVYAIVLGLCYVSELDNTHFNLANIEGGSAILALAALVFSYHVFNTINKTSNKP